MTRRFTLLIAARKRLIVQAMESLQLLESLATQGIWFTFFLSPSEDTESMNNLLDLFYFAGDRVDYIVAHNPASVRTNLFKKSDIEAELKKFGAKELTLPVVTSITSIKRAEAKAGRKLSFAEVATPGSEHLELMLAGEMQWAMQQVFRQYDTVADLLVPSEQMPDNEIEPLSEPAAKPARSKQPMLNLGE